ANEVMVGVMGLGVLGRAAASALYRLCFRVAGWSRTPKTLTDIATFHGDGGLDAFLRRTEILVCLLPATPSTRGLLESCVKRQTSNGGTGGYVSHVQQARSQNDPDAGDDGRLHRCGARMCLVERREREPAGGRGECRRARFSDARGVGRRVDSP